MHILEELAKEAIERIRCSEKCSEVIERVKCSKKYSEEVIKRVGCGKGRSNNDDRRVS